MDVGFTPPAHDAPDIEFTYPAGIDRHIAVSWAGGIVADHVQHPAPTIVSAARILKANSPEHHRVATWLLEITPVPEVAHDA